MNKETVVALIEKEQKECEGFVEYIVKQLSQGLSDKLITILDTEKEVIVRQSELRVSEYYFPEKNSVEYRQEIEWIPLVRCKDCKHRDNDGFCHGRGWPIQLVPGDGFCDKGERRDDD